MQEDALAALAGRSLPGGRYRIEAVENHEFCNAVGVEPDPNGLAHPLFYYIASQAAMGVSVSDLLAMCAFDVDDGPMMVGSDASFAAELQVGVEYTVAGTIVSLTRKPSRTFGIADTLVFRLTLTDPEGLECVAATSSWILPRRQFT